MIPIMNRNIEKTEYEGGLYLRLSVEEAKQLRRTGESVSSSIKSQEILLKSCFEEKGIKVKKVYIDDGLTGQRFDDRTDFQNAIKDLEAGVINTLRYKRYGTFRARSHRYLYLRTKIFPRQ
jgi:DNA invertase Pin-like site-specific DNA recombinase